MLIFDKLWPLLFFWISNKRIMYKFLIHVVINTIFLIEQQKENWEKYFKTRSQLLLLIKLVTVKKKCCFPLKTLGLLRN